MQRPGWSELGGGAPGRRVRPVGVNQLNDLLHPVEDSHAKHSELLQAVREGVARDVARAEAVRQPALEPGKRRCHKLRDCLHPLHELVLYPAPVVARAISSPRDRQFDGVRSRQVFKCRPQKEKKMEYGFKAWSAFNAGQAGCHSRDGFWQPCNPNGNPGWRFGNLLPRFWQPQDRFWQLSTRNLATVLCRVAKAASQGRRSLPGS